MSIPVPEPFGPPLDVRELFPSERRLLLEVLAPLDVAGWSRPTVAPGWTVKDVATHVLGDDLGRLARTRDGVSGPEPARDEELPRFLDRINDEWVVAARRLSPRLIIEMLDWTGQRIAELWGGLAPGAPSEAVSWAGPQVAPVWLDAARDFSEYWTHQQQIREALGQPLLTDPRFVTPVIDTFMRALPHTLRDMNRPAGTALRFTVTGAGGGTWTVVRGAAGWTFSDDMRSPDATVTVDVDTARRLCTRAVGPATALDRSSSQGDRELARRALTILSIIRSDRGERNVNAEAGTSEVIRGERVLLRPATLDDVDVLTEMSRDPTVAAWWDDDSTDAGRARLTDDFEDSEEYAVELAGEPIGFAQWWEELDSTYRHAGIDLFLTAEHQGHGLGSEVVRTLARWLIEVRGHRRLIIDPAAANSRAIRAYERVGFRPVGVTRQSERVSDGSWRDQLLMDLLADELTPDVTHRSLRAT